MCCCVSLQAAGVIDTRDNILAYFVQLVREKLHIVLCFSPIGSGFRNRCLMFPALVNCCTIDWFSAWPADALFSVAKVFLEKDKKSLKLDAMLEPLCHMSVKIHKQVEASTVRYLEEEGQCRPMH